MKISLIAAEASPFAKVGGLGDVAGSLSKVLAKKGHLVNVFLPAYRSIPDLEQREKVGEVEIAWQGRIEPLTIRREVLHGIDFFFLENPRYFDRDIIYGCPDDVERFAFFSRSALESLPLLGFPEILHIHDWHTSPVPLYLETILAGKVEFSSLACVLTIHNLAFQGLVEQEMFSRIGLPLSFRDERIEFYGKANLLKGAILTSDFITTVSDTYGREIQTPALGMGLEGALALRKKQLMGITNGIDIEEYDPASFGLSLSNLRSRKPEIKTELQGKLGLPLDRDAPLLAMISRLTEQKGLDLFPPIMDRLLAKPLQLVILGTGERRYEEYLRDLSSRFPQKFTLRLTFDEELAKQIYAGADIFLMPSRFEPCGLGQLIALRYGTVPVVRKTGGLTDTVSPYNPETGEGNGFLFNQYEAGAFLTSLEEALEHYALHTHWDQIRRTGMSEDHSWSSALPSYEKVYRKALFFHGKRKGAIISPEIRKDPILEEWSIIAKGRTKRPSDFKVPADQHVTNDTANCPFCEQHEGMTPYELFAIRKAGTRANEPGWSVRVFDNKFPALIKEEEPAYVHSHLYTSISGLGAHEVIVETPRHDLAMADLSLEQMELVCAAYRHRYRELSKNKDLRYILIFRNYGRSAGASLSHPHSQLIATPIVPRRIKEELDSAHTYWEHTGQCIFCDSIQEELAQGKRLVYDSADFIVFEPYASRFPFETLILPKRHQAAFSELDNGEVESLAQVLLFTLGRLKEVVNDPPYNMMIHSSPLGLLFWPEYHWHIEIIPRLTTPAGFEWGTDFYINPTPPEEAARFLKKQG